MNIITTIFDFVHRFVLAIGTLVAGLPVLLKVAVITFSIALALTLIIQDRKVSR